MGHLMTSIAISGATSMLGIATVNACIEHGINVIAIVRKNSQNISRMPKSNLINVIECNLDDLKAIKTDLKCDTFIHFAWSGANHEGRSNVDMQSHNIQYAIDAVELAHKMGCNKFIGAGSQAEYGPKYGDNADYSTENPNTAYGLAKRVAGKLTRMRCDQLDMIHVWTRIFSTFGYNDTPESMIMYAIRSMIDGSCGHYSNARQQWDYLFADDAGEMFYSLAQKAKKSTMVPIASGVHKALKDFIYDIRDTINPDAELTFEDNAEDLPGLSADITNLTNIIGDAKITPFKDGIKIILDKMRKSGDAL